ncbi:MAG: tRNA pseudouridine(55) synthase TruB [Alphaproteobacteria bacterium]
MNGWLILDKPLGLSSTQALGKARRLLGAKKAGHGGTLDPLASGVLPLAFGEATKLISFVMDGRKEYRFTVRWGEARTTDDAEGDVTAVSEVRPTETAIRAALPGFIGDISQTPPIFSAIKVAGERAYDLARAGEKVELASRIVQVFDFQLISIDDNDHASFAVTCGKGTYVRSLARDLALKLGTAGYVSALRRDRSGPFTLDRAISLENLAELSHKGEALTALLDIGAALDDIPARVIDDREARLLRHGQGIMPQPGEILPNPNGTQPVLATHHGNPVALIAPKDGIWHPVRGFNL